MSQVPLVGLRAHAVEGDRERCLEAGTDGHIARPLQPAGPVETVEREGEPRTE
jgi:CheY-like chemotaxis protein